MTTLVLGAIRETYRLKFFRTAYFCTQPERACDTNLGKVVNVAIIGAPNAGKSTLINNIIERKICAASSKVQTTTKLMRAMCYQNNTQIVFLDTPGVITTKEKRKYNLPDSMMEACHKSLRVANVIGVIHDASNRYLAETLHSDVIKLLKSFDDIPSFLIINKIDVIKNKHRLLQLIKTLTNGYIAGNPVPNSEPSKKKTNKKGDSGYGKFSDVFLISALNGDGVHDIKEYLLSNAKPARFQYSPEVWTDQLPESLIEEAVRAQFLNTLPQDIPYLLKYQLEYFEENQERIICSVSVECPSERLAKLIAGAGGGRLNIIKSELKKDLLDLFKKIVSIDIILRVKKKSTE